MNYRPIELFPEPNGYEFPELWALTTIWKERRATLEKSPAYHEFMQRLQREWAIETGIIERLYVWDRGVTEVLIRQGIEASSISHHGGISQRDAEHVRAVIHDHLDIVEGLFGYVKGDEPLSEYFIRGLQAQFTAHQDDTEAMTEGGERVRVKLLKGEYKKHPNNPRRSDGSMHIYCPPEHVKDEMENLIRIYREAEPHYRAEFKAAWLHHRFTQIHPFQDGNGRVARALASLVFLRDGLLPLVVRESDRQDYIGALESADAGELKPLVDFFARRQRDALLKVLGLEQEAQLSKPVDQIIDSALHVLKARLHSEHQQLESIAVHANKLLELAAKRFTLITDGLSDQLTALSPQHASKPYGATTDGASNEDVYGRDYFQRQISEIAQALDYFANVRTYHAWTRIKLQTAQEFDYVVSFHGYGQNDLGIFVASAFTSQKAPSETGMTNDFEVQPATIEPFHFNYAEAFETIEQRFKEWLEASVALAMMQWRRSLG